MKGKDLYLRLLRYVRPYTRQFALSLLAMLVLAAAETGVAALLKPLFDGSFVDKDLSTVQLMPFALVGIFMVRGMANFASTVGMRWVAGKVVLDLRKEMLDKLLRLPNSYYDHNSTGSVMSKLIYDVSKVTAAATDALIVLVRDSLTMIGLLAWIIYLNWKLAMIVFVIAPAVAIVIKVVSKRMREMSRSQQENMGDFTHVLEETVLGNKVVKTFGGQEYERKRFAHVANWLRRYQVKITVTSAGSVPIVQVITSVAMAIIIYLASMQSLEDEVTIGGFVSFIVAMGLLLSPMKRLTGINEAIQKGIAAAESIFGLLDEVEEYDDPAGKPVSRVAGRVEFQDVVFTYKDAPRAAIDNLNLTIEAGETVAFVGASGSGKTTLAALLPRFYNANSGSILIDGVDIMSIPLRSLRQQISLVSQDVMLFNDSVAANIAYGEMAGASEGEIIAAAEHAYAMEFINDMPEGLQTLVGENGTRLSGGQRQRLAIARALLKDAPILILDEATSALDTKSEHHVQLAMENVSQGRTTLIIAHRLSTIQNADRIVVLEQGKIIEIGKHNALLAKEGVYARLYMAQQEASGPDD